VGYPDWSYGQLVTPPNVGSFQFLGAGTGDTVNVVTTPPGGQRVRLLAYRINLSYAMVLGATAGNAQLLVSLQASGGTIKDRMSIQLQALANGVAYFAMDSGLIVCPGGGIALPVNETLDFRVQRFAPAGATVNFVTYLNRYWITETP